MERADVEAWVAAYEGAWRRAGTDRLGELFTDDGSYQASPWRQPLQGLEEIARFWEAERDGPDEDFTMRSDVVALDGDTAVVRVEVDYTGRRAWRDLWIIRFAPDGRCAAFEEWPFTPDQPDGH